jgi:hypothetical protein
MVQDSSNACLQGDSWIESSLIHSQIQAQLTRIQQTRTR